MDTERTFPGDACDGRARNGRNISETERWISMAAGAGLVAYGMSRRRHGWIWTTLGGLAFRRGFVGHCLTYQLLGISTAGTRRESERAIGAASQ